MLRTRRPFRPPASLGIHRRRAGSKSCQLPHGPSSHSISCHSCHASHALLHGPSFHSVSCNSCHESLALLEARHSSWVNSLLGRLLGLNDTLLSEQPAIGLGPPVLVKVARPLLALPAGVEVNLGDDKLAKRWRARKGDAGSARARSCPMPKARLTPSRSHSLRRSGPAGQQ